MDTPVDRDLMHPVVLTADEAAAHQTELARLKALAERCLGPIGDGTPTARRDAEEVSREHAVTTARIVELESLLRSAQVLPRSAPLVVAVGVDVEVRYVVAARTVTYRVTAASLPGRGAVSMHSPIGQALMGRSVGEQVEVELPNGRRETLRIMGLSIDGTAVVRGGAVAHPVRTPAATIRSWPAAASPPL